MAQVNQLHSKFKVGDRVQWTEHCGENNEVKIIGNIVGYGSPEPIYTVLGNNQNVLQIKPQSELSPTKGGMRKTKKIRRNRKGRKQRKQTRGRKQRGGVQELNPMDFKTAYLSPPHGPTGQSVADLVPREQYLRSPYGEYQRGGYQDEIIRPMSLKEAYPGKNLDPSGQPAY